MVRAKSIVEEHTIFHIYMQISRLYNRRIHEKDGLASLRNIAIIRATREMREKEIRRRNGRGNKLDEACKCRARGNGESQGRRPSPSLESTGDERGCFISERLHLHNIKAHLCERVVKNSSPRPTSSPDVRPS